MEKQTELLAPAGNLDILKTAVTAGADAVYFGGDKFGARAYADNFSREDAENGIRYAHLFGRKCYLTLNTLLKDREVEDDLIDYLEFYYNAGIDAVLVQDIGVFFLIKSCFPDLPIHVSTQMSVTSEYGVSYLKELGASRIVLARELSLSEIKQIHKKTGAELECFLHGALCISYSGQCLMSSFLGGRSGNRGRCAQPCRLSYKAFDINNNPISKNPSCLLSTRDLAGIRRIPEMIEAGVYSFKIEGRMKTESYVSSVVRLYRHYLDLAMEDPADYKVTESDYNKLLMTGNRSGFTDLYFDRHNGPGLIAENSSMKSSNTADIKKHLKREIDVHVTVREGMESEVLFYDSDGTFIMNYKGQVSSHAKNCPISEDDVIKHFIKTGQTPFSIRKIKADVIGSPFLTIKSLNNMRRESLSRLLILMSGGREPKEIPSGNLPFNFSDVNKKEIKDPSTEILVSTPHQLSAVCRFLEESDKRCDILLSHRFILDDSYKDSFREIKTSNSKIRRYGLLMPDVLRADTADKLLKSLNTWSSFFDYYRAQSYDSLGFLLSCRISHDKIGLSMRLSGWSAYSQASFKSLGFGFDTVPVELMNSEIKARDNKISSLIIYGRMPMMIKADCTMKDLLSCKKTPGILFLEDRTKARIPVINDCSICMNTVYNANIYTLFPKPESALSLKPGAYSLYFTTETEDDVTNVLRMYRDCFLKGIPSEPVHSYTYGHFFKGVM